MFCPRCGTENEPGSRYCVSCGHEFAKAPSAAGPEPAASGGARGGFERLVGTTRRSRMITLGTVAALIVAVAAFIALAPAGDDSPVPQDGLTKALDLRCVQHKAEIAAAQKRALAAGSLTALSAYAEAIVPIAGEWRKELARAEAPADRADLIAGLSGALLEVQIEAGTMARAAREADRREVATAAARVDAATTHVEAAIQALELERCGQLEISQGELIRQ